MTGRRLSPNGKYAREVGLVGNHAGRAIALRGGAEKLRKMDPDARAVLLKSPTYGNSRTIADGGIAARGLGQRRGHKPWGYKHQFRDVEREIQLLLRERGLA